MPDRLLLSCEHAGRKVPAPYAALFTGAEADLDSHRGWDPGALELARTLAEELDAPLHATDVTRLLVDANRSMGHPRLFSEWSRTLPVDERRKILERYWAPHRETVEAAVADGTAIGRRVLHLSVHTFTPVWNGRERPIDVGLLYDPSRSAERSLCLRWRRELSGTAPPLRVRMNAPYRGVDDGLTAHLRRRLPETSYLGVELEVSQRLVAGDRLEPGLARHLGRTLRRAAAAVEDQPSSEAS